MVESNPCPCCGQFIKEFKVPLSKNNIKVLLTLWTLNRDSDYFETKDVYDKVKGGSATAELSRLKYLGAIKPYFTPEDRLKRSKRSGKWIVTDAGSRFLRNFGTLPEYVIVRNKVVVGCGDEISVDNKKLKWQTEDDIWKELKRYWDA